MNTKLQTRHQNQPAQTTKHKGIPLLLAHLSHKFSRTAIEFRTAKVPNGVMKLSGPDQTPLRRYILSLKNDVPVQQPQLASLATPIWRLKLDLIPTRKRSSIERPGKDRKRSQGKQKRNRMRESAAWGGEERDQLSTETRAMPAIATGHTPSPL